MKAIVLKRARIARVRRVQHMQAAAAAAAAQLKLRQLEISAERLAALRGSLECAPGPSSGAALSNSAELAMRLEFAREGLTDAIVSARATVAERTEQRVEARRRKEGADKLGDRAAAAFDRMIEHRMSASQPFRRGVTTLGDEE